MVPSLQHHPRFSPMQGITFLVSPHSLHPLSLPNGSHGDVFQCKPDQITFPFTTLWLPNGRSLPGVSPSLAWGLSIWKPCLSCLAFWVRPEG